MSSVSSRELLVVDGYNVIFKGERYRSRMDETAAGDPFEQAREQLVADVAAFAQGRFEPVIVFDAAGNVSPERPSITRGGVRLIFSEAGESADTVIERLVAGEREAPRAVTVVTSDAAIRATVGGVPVTRLSSDALVSDAAALAAEAEQENAERQHQHMTVEDRLDAGTLAKLNALIGR